MFQIVERQVTNPCIYPFDSFEQELISLRAELKIIDETMWKKRKIKDIYEEILNIPCSFDIETTSWKEKENKKATMYAFVFGFNGKVFVGRTWKEALSFFKIVSDFFGLDVNKRIICYVHNLGYEFQFIRKLLVWQEVFAVDARTPVKAISKLGIEFRDSLALSGYSLAKVSEHLLKYKVKKKVGDLDYLKKRNSFTLLTPAEWGYIFNDGLVVMAYIQEQIEMNDNDIRKIPITKTSYVRRYMRDCCYFKNAKNHKDSDGRYYRYRHLMKLLTLDVEEYKELKRAFHGGFTHANALNSFITCKDVTSMDFTSSYPAVLVSEKFPMSNGLRVHPKNIEDFNSYLKNYCVLFDVKFTKIESNNYGDNPISLSKCWNIDNYIVDNGRIEKADMICTTLTDVDFQVIKKFYHWKEISVTNVIIYRREYLPKNFVEGVLHLYKNKTELKGVEGMEAEYMHSKEDLNACFGMSVTDIVRDENIYEIKKGEWLETHEGDVEKEIEKYNKDRKRFLSYAWGIWCTAYAQRNLFTGIYSMRNSGDYIYSDTDSLKIMNYDQHKGYFEKYNRVLETKLKKAMEKQGIDFSNCKPKTKNGIEKLIGVWDYDGHYKKFKTCGAKRYICEDDEGKLHITISGVSKKSGVNYLWYKYKTIDKIFDSFKDGLLFPSLYGDNIEGCGKKIHMYLDEPIKGTIKDYQGNVANYFEESAVYMEPTSYEMSMSDCYIKYLKDYKESMQRYHE